MRRVFPRVEFAFRLPLLVFLSLMPSIVMAQVGGDCKGPDVLEQAIATHPSSAAYDALGAYFAGHRRLDCAIAAFESAVRLSPKGWEGHYDLGIALMSRTNLKRAATELQIASELKPDTPKILLPLGVCLSQLNRQDAAMDAFRSVVKLEPRSVPALDGLTKILIAQGRYAAAIAELKDAPKDEVLRLNLAVAYSKNGDTAEALEILTSIVKEHPDYAQAHTNLGIVYTQQKRFHEAAAEFEMALRLDPQNDEIRLSYAKTLTAILYYSQAKPVILDYLQRHPHEFEALYFAGVVERGMGEYENAEKVLRQAVAINPQHAEAHYHLGFVLAHLQRPAEAQVELQKALALNPESSEARFQLAAVLRTLGETDKAHEELKVFQQKKEEDSKQASAVIKALQANQDLQSGDAQKAVALYRESLANDPKNARTYYDLALALDRLADYSSEREALEKAQELDPKLALVHNQLGFLELKDGHTRQAENQFKTAIAMDPQYAEAQNNLGVLYGQLGREAEAERMFRLATENNPQYGQAFANLGMMLAGSGRLPEAEKTLSKAVELNPKNTGALSVYGMVLVRLNRGSEALSFFRKVTELDPNSAGAHMNLGIALADLFDLNGALNEFSQAATLEPQNASAHYNKGRVLLDLQRNQEAKPELERATQLDAQAADSWYLLGLIARQADQTDVAIEQFKRALAAKPDNPEALFMLGQEFLRKGENGEAAKQWRRALELRPQYSEALYNLARLEAKSNPEEAKRLQANFQELQTKQHIMDRAQSLGNFALASAEAHDWPAAISQLKDALNICGDCSALAALHKDLGLIYCRAGDFSDGRKELLAAQKLAAKDEDVAKALEVLDALQKH